MGFVRGALNLRLLFLPSSVEKHTVDELVMLHTEELIAISGFLLAFKALNALSSGRTKDSTREGMHFIWGDWDIVVDQESIKVARNGDRTEQDGARAIYPSGWFICWVVETQDVFSINSCNSVSAVGHESMYVLGNFIDVFVPVSS